MKRSQLHNNTVTETVAEEMLEALYHNLHSDNENCTDIKSTRI